MIYYNLIYNTTCYTTLYDAVIQYNIQRYIPQALIAHNSNTTSNISDNRNNNDDINLYINKHLKDNSCSKTFGVANMMKLNNLTKLNKRATQLLFRLNEGKGNSKSIEKVYQGLKELGFKHSYAESVCDKVMKDYNKL